MVVRQLKELYECWRISGDAKFLIRFCPQGNHEMCMFLGTGNMCPTGKTIHHGSREFMKLKTSR